MDFFSTKIAYADLDTFIGKVDSLIINPLITLLFALAVVYFLYGMFEFIANAENDEKKTSGKQHMLWGVVGLTIMMGVWFILNVILSTFNISSDVVNPEKGTVNLPPSP
jgi:succinate dehydrogenase/fumarate reductase cytochrome b subunit